MRIDAHQHFWDLNRLPYPWMPTDASSPLRRDYFPEHLRPILARNKFHGSVAVQATTSPDEAPWLLSLADQHRFILGVVAWVNLADPHLGDTLDELQKHPRFRGVRHPVHDEDDEQWLLRPGVIAGLQELERRDIPFDLLLRPRHLSMIPELAGNVPQLRMVIDHIAKPGIKEKHWEPWAGDIERVAAFPQIMVKLSGMITEANLDSWKSKDLRPYVHHVLRVFGFDRCMFGSDWPVCRLAGTWKEVLAGFTQAHGPIDKDLRVKLTGENAARFYGLDVPDQPITAINDPGRP